MRTCPHRSLTDIRAGLDTYCPWCQKTKLAAAVDSFFGGGQWVTDEDTTVTLWQTWIVQSLDPFLGLEPDQAKEVFLRTVDEYFLERS